MQKYIVKRVIYAIPAIFGVTVLIFTMMRVLPGDPLGSYFGIEAIQKFTPGQRAALMHSLGLDRPLVIQYGAWMGNVLTGDFGTSLFRSDSILATLGTRGPISAQIGVISVVISWVIGLPVGLLSALRPQSVSDTIANGFTVLFLAIPGFWLGLVIVAAGLTWFGYKAPVTAVQVWQDPWGNFQIIVGPAVVLGLGQAAFIARMARSSLLDVLREDYVRTARSKGLMEKLVLIRHALPNALLPVLTLSGILLGFVLGGSVAVEKAFAAPGLGKTMVSAAIDRDYNVVQNITLLYALIFVTVNLVVDILYGYLDPRIRFE